MRRRAQAGEGQEGEEEAERQDVAGSRGGAESDGVEEEECFLWVYVSEAQAVGVGAGQEEVCCGVYKANNSAR